MTFSESHFVILSQLYENFARRESDPQASTFADFQTFVRRAEPKDLKQIEDLCVRWFWHYWWDQLTALVIVTTVLLYLAFVLLLLVGAVYAASKVLPIPFLDNLVSAVNLGAPINVLYARLPIWLQDIFRQPWVKWASMLLALASFSVTRFLRHYLGDVLQ